MGYSISWLAVKDADPDAVCEQLGLIRSGAFDEYYSYPQHSFLGGVLETGWYVVVRNRCDDPMVLDEVLSSISAGSTVIAASIEEHVMFCFATCWFEGKEIWRVQHEAEKGITDLQVTGAPPAELEDIRQRAFIRQMVEGDDADVDYIFDVPLHLAKSFVGFKHDENTPGPELEFFEILRVAEAAADSPPKKKRWKLS
jgi:hypothetical protein